MAHFASSFVLDIGILAGARFKDAQLGTWLVRFSSSFLDPDTLKTRTNVNVKGGGAEYV